MTDLTGHPWFALRVRSNHERVAATHLRGRGIEEFSPTYRAEQQWSDRKKQVERCLFPGYVFCRLNLADRMPALSVPGAVGLIGFGSGPCPIPTEEIAAIQQMIGSGLLVAPWPFLRTGQRVLVERGPLEGVEGILQEIRKTYRLVVSVEMLQRSVSVELDRAWVRPVSESRSHPVLNSLQHRAC